MKRPAILFAPRLPAAVRLVLMAHLLAYGYSLRTGRYVFLNTDRYVQAAYNLRHFGRLYARPPSAGPLTGQAMRELTIRPPGYPLLVLALGAAGEPRGLAAAFLK